MDDFEEFLIFEEISKNNSNKPNGGCFTPIIMGIIISTIFWQALDYFLPLF